MESALTEFALCSQKWFDFVIKNTGKVTSYHTSVFMWAAELQRREPTNQNLIFPTPDAMAVSGIKSRTTYVKVIADLSEWGMITIIHKSANRYEDTIIHVFSCPLNEQLDGQLNEQLDGQLGFTCPLNEQLDVSCPSNEQLDGQLNGTTHTDAYTREELLNNNILNNNILINNNSVEEQLISFKEIKNKESFPLIISQEEEKQDLELENVPVKTKQPAKPKKPATPKVPRLDVKESLIQKIRLKNESDFPEVRWSGFHAGRAKELIKLLGYSFKVTRGSEPDDDEIFNSFELLIQKLPGWAKNYSIDFLVKHYERIIQAIKNPQSISQNGTYKDRSAQYHDDKNASLSRTLQNLNERAYANGGKSAASKLVDSILAGTAKKNDTGHSAESAEPDFEFTE